MRNIYCSACGGVVPGLEESEFAEFGVAYEKCVLTVKEYRSEYQVSLDDTPITELYLPAIEKYRELTGFEGKDSFHLYRKHRVSRFKLCCQACGTYFVAPRTKTCPNCGELGKES